MRRSFLKLALAPAALGLLSLTGCVSEQRYDELETAYQRLQGQYTADQATIQMLQGRLKVTMSDRILFPSGGYRIEAGARRDERSRFEEIPSRRSSGPTGVESV